MNYNTKLREIKNQTQKKKARIQFFFYLTEGALKMFAALENESKNFFVIVNIVMERQKDRYGDRSRDRKREMDRELE